MNLQEMIKRASAMRQGGQGCQCSCCEAIQRLTRLNEQDRQTAGGIVDGTVTKAEIDRLTSNISIRNAAIEEIRRFNKPRIEAIMSNVSEKTNQL